MVLGVPALAPRGLRMQGDPGCCLPAPQQRGNETGFIVPFLVNRHCTREVTHQPRVFHLRKPKPADLPGLPRHPSTCVNLGRGSKEKWSLPQGLTFPLLGACWVWQEQDGLRDPAKLHSLCHGSLGGDTGTVDMPPVGA